MRVMHSVGLFCALCAYAWLSGARAMQTGFEPQLRTAFDQNIFDTRLAKIQALMDVLQGIPNVPEDLLARGRALHPEWRSYHEKLRELRAAVVQKRISMRLLAFLDTLTEDAATEAKRSVEWHHTQVFMDYERFSSVRNGILPTRLDKCKERLLDELDDALFMNMDSTTDPDYVALWTSIRDMQELNDSIPIQSDIWSAAERLKHRELLALAQELPEDTPERDAIFADIGGLEQTPRNYASVEKKVKHYLWRQRLIQRAMQFRGEQETQERLVAAANSLDIYNWSFEHHARTFEEQLTRSIKASLLQRLQAADLQATPLYASAEALNIYGAAFYALVSELEARAHGELLLRHAPLGIILDSA